MLENFPAPIFFFEIKAKVEKLQVNQSFGVDQRYAWK